jgi:hypothetical protein
MGTRVRRMAIRLLEVFFSFACGFIEAHEKWCWDRPWLQVPLQSISARIGAGSRPDAASLIPYESKAGTHETLVANLGRGRLPISNGIRPDP